MKTRAFPTVKRAQVIAFSGAAGARSALARGRATRVPHHRSVNLLDENIPLDQRDILRAWGIRCLLASNIAAITLTHDLIALVQQTLDTVDACAFAT